MGRAYPNSTDKLTPTGQCQLSRRAHSRTDVVADPLPSLIVGHRGEDVEAGLEPRRDALRDLDRLVQLVFGGKDAVHGRLRSLEGEVAVQLHHGGFGRNRFRPVNLDLVVVLRLADHAPETERQYAEDYRQPRTGRHSKQDRTKYYERSVVIRAQLLLEHHHPQRREVEQQRMFVAVAGNRVRCGCRRSCLRRCRRRWRHCCSALRASFPAWGLRRDSRAAAPA